MKNADGFGKTSSKILLGTSYFGDAISLTEAFSIMDTFYRFGGRHIDTARSYGNGNAEKIIAKWIADRKPKDLIVSTKGGFYDTFAGKPPRLNEADLRSDLETSLNELQVPCIDFYWLHRDDETKPVCEIIDVLNQFIKEGKIKGFGASNWKHKRIEEANNYAKEKGLVGFSASQIRFSPAVINQGNNVDRTLVDLDEENFMFYRQHNMPVAAFASQAKGFFSKIADKDGYGLSEKSKERYLCQENLRRFEVIKQLSVKYNCTVASMVCAILCSVPYIDVFPIIGGSNPLQIEDSIKGADVSVSADDIKKVFKGEQYFV